MGNDYKDHPVYQRLMKPGPKRILALDGGGIRGALTLGYLHHIEVNLRKKFNRKNLVLSDYYDLIGGTSTGAIIATLLSLGNSVEDITKLYLKLGNKIFTKRKHILNWWYFKFLLSSEYNHKILEKELNSFEQINSLTLGSSKIKTGLAIFCKRADTKSTWIFHNNPIGKYYPANKGLRIEDLLRATSAAPSYFKPHEITFNDNESAIFIDGGVSMANNPSLMMYLLSTIEGYGYKWKSSSDHILLTSVGTGFKKMVIQKEEKSKMLNKKSVLWAKEIPDLFMFDASEMNQYIMQILSIPMRPEKINSEILNLENDLITNKPLLEYCRYNNSLGKDNLASLGFDALSKKQLNNIDKMDKGENAKILNEIGLISGSKSVLKSHFPAKFDFGVEYHKPIILDKVSTISRFVECINKKGLIFEKYRCVFAIKCDEKQTVISITSSGIETEAQANIGDFIVRNQTDNKEFYVVKSEVFKSRYEYVSKKVDGYNEYKPTGKVEAVKLNYEILQELELPLHFYINPPNWDSKQYIGIDDYIVRIPQTDDYYRIDEHEFIQTYRLTK